MCGTAAGGFMCFIVRLIARPFMSWSDTTPAPNEAGTRSYLAAIRTTDEGTTLAEQTSNLPTALTSLCSVEPNNESCKQSPRLRSAAQVAKAILGELNSKDWTTLRMLCHAHG